MIHKSTEYHPITTPRTLPDKLPNSVSTPKKYVVTAEKKAELMAMCDKIESELKLVRARLEIEHARLEYLSACRSCRVPRVNWELYILMAMLIFAAILSIQGMA